MLEQMPEFPGGESSLIKFIQSNLVYPVSSKSKGIQGKVIIRFCVTSIGNIEKAEVVRGLDPECNKEALRVINLLPTWTPGKQDGKNIRVYYTIPIQFKL